MREEVYEMTEEAILKVENLTKYYTSGYILTKKVLGCKDVTFDIKKGEIFILVGESGSGKTTIARLILRFIKPTSGKIYLDGKDIYSYDRRTYYQKVQAVFQNPYTSFNPRYGIKRVFDDVFDFLLKDKNYSEEEKQKLIASALNKVKLRYEQIIERAPYELSGGQMQRLLIARALLVRPKLLIADEITSMIDASIRVDILNELKMLREEENLSILFITHDMGQAYYIANKMAIMWKGRLIEIDTPEEILFNPKTDYAKNLIASVPKLHQKWEL